MKNMSPSVTRPVSISTLGVASKPSQDSNRKLPGSNHGPCCCTPSKGDRITGMPDYVLRPARMEVDLSNIGPGKTISQKGYAVISPKKEALGMDSGGYNEEAGE